MTDDERGYQLCNDMIALLNKYLTDSEGADMKELLVNMMTACAASAACTAYSMSINLDKGPTFALDCAAEIGKEAVDIVKMKYSH